MKNFFMLPPFRPHSLMAAFDMAIRRLLLHGLYRIRRIWL
jgi:hypothetical protein